MSEEKEIAKVESGPGDFGECLVEGSAEDKKRERKIKRRAIAISIALQSAGLAALVIAPMLAKPAELGTRPEMMPIPPYNARPAQRQITQTPLDRLARQRCSFCAPTKISPTIVTRDTDHHTYTPIGPDIPIGIETNSKDGLIQAIDTRVQPKMPEPPPPQKRVSIGHIDPALLVNRVEPVFPPLARQIRKSGKVELHAVIAMDGTIQSLQVVSGDPMFLESALAAVRQWRYRPTLLNGQPVEVDTFITVIYTLNSQ
jgi:periplasmic protein TonB